MKKPFSEIVEEIKQLDPDKKFELRELLDKYLIAERRGEILTHYKTSQAEESRLNFSSKVSDLRENLPM